MAGDERGGAPDPDGRTPGHVDRTELETAAELMRARAVVVHDLVAAGLDSPAAVDVVENAVTGRTWWVRSWPGGSAFVAGQVAQDVQERLLDDADVRWPRCRSRECAGRTEHSLTVEPELGPDPHWVCEQSGAVIAALGQLPSGAAG